MPNDDEVELRRLLGKQIRQLRLERGLTLREAAVKCGLSFAMLSMIEKHGQNTTLDKIEKIVNGLGGRLVISAGDDDNAATATEADDAPRVEVGRRFARILPRIPDEELDVFVHELALWERRYGGQ